MSLRVFQSYQDVRRRDPQLRPYVHSSTSCRSSKRYTCPTCRRRICWCNGTTASERCDPCAVIADWRQAVAAIGGCECNHPWQDRCSCTAKPKGKRAPACPCHNWSDDE